MWIIILTSNTVSAQSATYLIRYNILFLTPLSTHFICIFTLNHAKLSLALSQKAESMKRGLDEPNDNPSANARTRDTEVVNNWYPLPHITVALTASGSLDNWHLPRLVVPEQVIMSSNHRQMWEEIYITGHLYHMTLQDATIVRVWKKREISGVDLMLLYERWVGGVGEYWRKKWLSRDHIVTIGISTFWLNFVNQKIISKECSKKVKVWTLYPFQVLKIKFTS